jgi:hypothetical protein
LVVGCQQKSRIGGGKFLVVVYDVREHFLNRPDYGHNSSFYTFRLVPIVQTGTEVEMSLKNRNDSGFRCQSPTIAFGFLISDLLTAGIAHANEGRVRSMYVQHTAMKAHSSC